MTPEGALDFYFYADNALLRSPDRYTVYGSATLTNGVVKFTSTFPLYDELCIYEFWDINVQNSNICNRGSCINMCGDFLYDGFSLSDYRFTVRIVGHERKNTIQIFGI